MSFLPGELPVPVGTLALLGLPMGTADLQRLKIQVQSSDSQKAGPALVRTIEGLSTTFMSDLIDMKMSIIVLAPWTTCWPCSQTPKPYLLRQCHCTKPKS